MATQEKTRHWKLFASKRVPQQNGVVVQKRAILFGTVHPMLNCGNFSVHKDEFSWPKWSTPQPHWKIILWRYVISKVLFISFWKWRYEMIHDSLQNLVKNALWLSNYSLIYRVKWITAIVWWLTLLECHCIQLNCLFKIRNVVVIPSIDPRALIDVTHTAINQMTFLVMHFHHLGTMMCFSTVHRTLDIFFAK